MALLSVMNNGTSSTASSLSSSDMTGFLIFLFVVIIFIGLIWLFVIIINLANEKKKYYDNLNKELAERRRKANVE